MGVLVITIYCFFHTFILAYSVSQLHLAFVYRNWKKGRTKPPQPSTLANLPVVTIQLPIFNEKYVVERLLKATSSIRYPKEKLEIQVLDDSTDETKELTKKLVAQYVSQGFRMAHITRPDRKDFKAGALQYGMERCCGDFIAIFDADFVPRPDFLERTLPHFSNPDVGVVQSRWAHLNEDYSLLTKLQSYALNAHFTIEQTGRSLEGHFINFNGTAGIWRKTTIEDAGGWEGDTLTEDLDLSYRAQLKKWRFVYLQDLESPAELPAEMNALKSQQYRWAKGAAECVTKNLPRVFRASHLKMKNKLFAFFHLMNSFIWVCLLCSGMLLIPFLHSIENLENGSPLLSVLWVYHISFFALLFFYTTANSSLSLKSQKDYLKFFLSYPAFLSLSMGLSLHNAKGVILGYLGVKSAFVRTPKFNIVSRNDGIKGKQYVSFKLSFISLLEVICLGYFCWGTWITFQMANFVAMPFMVMQAFGFATVIYYSIAHSLKAKIG